VKSMNPFYAQSQNPNQFLTITNFQAWKCRHQLRLLQAPRLASWIELKILLRY
jgi:hypothetical protein